MFGMRQLLVPIALFGLTLASPSVHANRVANEGPKAPKQRHNTQSGRYNVEAYRTQRKSLQMSVTNPTKAAAAVSRAVRKGGGFIESSSSSETSARVEGRLPRGQLGAVAAIVEGLPGVVASANTSTTDLRQAARALLDRMTVLDAAEAQVTDMLGTTADPEERRGLVLVVELIARERSALDSNLNSYRSQTEFALLSVSFSKQH